MARKQKSSNTATGTNSASASSSFAKRKNQRNRQTSGSARGGGGGGDTGVDDYDDEDLSVTEDGNLLDGLSESYTILSSDDIFSLSDPFLHDNDDDEDDDDHDHTRNAYRDNANEYKLGQEQEQYQNHTKLIQCLNMATSLCTERRSTLREKGLKLLFRGITQYATGETGQEIIQSRLHADILPICINGLKGGRSSPVEQYASCRILEATSIVLGMEYCLGREGVDEVEVSDEQQQQQQGGSEYVSLIYGPLVRVVKVTQRALQVRRAALRALAMACFISSWSVSGSDYGCHSEEVENVMSLCEAVGRVEFRGERVDSRLRATAWECWALLGTTMGNVSLASDVDVDVDADVDGESDEQEEEDGQGDDDDDVSSSASKRMMRCGVRVLPLLSECLDSSVKDLNLRRAVGECLALIHEARLNLGMEGGGGSAENASMRRYERGSWEGSEWEVVMDEVKQRVAELSVESGKHMSKKAKKDTRATFREFMATIVDDEPPCEVVAFRGGQLTLSSWKEIIQLNFVRRCLQTGFQIQLMTNETLQMIFGVDASVLNTVMQLSQLEKRHTQSKTSEASKQAYNQRNKNRKSKIRAKYSFLDADGDEF